MITVYIFEAHKTKPGKHGGHGPKKCHQVVVTDTPGSQHMAGGLLFTGMIEADRRGGWRRALRQIASEALTRKRL